MKISLFIYFVIYALLASWIPEACGYTVVGTKIYDPNGKQVRLRGVDRCSLEWSETGENLSLQDYTLMHSWGANVVRIALNQDYWLASSAYIATIAQQVAWISTLPNFGIIFDLHWNNGGQQEMADLNSITFWGQLAAIYANNSWVIFELYNEPHDIPWSTWQSGDGTWAGMQQLYNAVRGAGANNMVIINGLNWAFDLSGVPSYPINGTNIAYGTHPYDYSGKQLTDWPTAFGYLAATAPVMMTEFGQYCDNDTYSQDLLAYADSLDLHWSAWAWYVSGCAFPSIIADWSGTPISGVGELVYAALSGNTTYTTSGSITPPPIPTVTTPLVVYFDSLQNGFQDWSWSTSYNLSSTTYVYSGSYAIQFAVQDDQGLYFHNPSTFALGSYSSIQFYVNGGTQSYSANDFLAIIYDQSASQIGSVTWPAGASPNTWTTITIPITSFGAALSTQISGLAFQANVGSALGNIFIDDISFLPAPASNTGSALSSSSHSSSSTGGSFPSTSSPTSSSTKSPSLTSTTLSPSLTSTTLSPSPILSSFSHIITPSSVLLIVCAGIVIFF